MFPPSPPASAPSSPESIAADARSITSISSRASISPNPLQIAPVTAVKPLLTPRSSEERVSVGDHEQTKVNSTILTTMFPASSGIHDLPSKAVDLTDIVSSWQGATLDNPAMGTRTLYVAAGGAGAFTDVNLRESVCGVLDKAEEDLACTGVVICLEKSAPELGELIHQLLYVGGTITNQPFAAKSAYVLVALDLM